MATDWVPAVTAGVGAAAAIGGQAVSALYQGRNQKRTEERQRREHAIAALADIRVWLTDAQKPLDLFMASWSIDTQQRDGSDRSDPKHTARLIEEQLANYKGMDEVRIDLPRRLQAIRTALQTMCVGHPTKKIRDLSQLLDIALAEIVGNTFLFSVEVRTVGWHQFVDAERQAMHSKAEADLGTALRIADELTEEIRNT